MATISLCMIVKNEEKTIERCLNSCKNLFDEIVIVDTGSTDKTKQIAQKFTEKIYYFNWQDDFSLARNYAFKQATCDYIMWLDADDVMPLETLNYLLKIKANLCADVYMLKYNIAFLNDKPTFSYFRERIIKNCENAIWQGVVHECIVPFGKVEMLDVAINHKKNKPSDKNRNYLIYKKISKERELTPREQYYFGRELYDHNKYRQCINVLKRFVDGEKGWVENVIDALYLMSECYRLLNQPKKQFECLTKTFYYDKPRANVACKIGDSFLETKNYDLAIFWYNLAINCDDVCAKGGFVEPMFYNYYPYLQMCVCHYCLGNIEESRKYNQMAKKYYASPQVLNNEKFFESLKMNNANE